MLQAQINPHFLYNTLSTLSWLVRVGKNEEAGRLIINLGDMLRAALSPKQNTDRRRRCAACAQLY